MSARFRYRPLIQWHNDNAAKLLLLVMLVFRTSLASRPRARLAYSSKMINDHSLFFSPTHYNSRYAQLPNILARIKSISAQTAIAYLHQINQYI